MKANMNQLVRSIAITSILLMLFAGMTVMADATPSDEIPVNLPDYILSCYDPYTPGFGDQPGWSSSLETTQHAVNLLLEHTDRMEWSNSLVHALDEIVERYASMQSWSRAGFQLETEDAPDFRTSALILETLNTLDRLDAVDVEEVLRYLWSSFRYSLSFDSRWFTEGDFESKYWALRTASAIEDYALENFERSAIGQMGLSRLELDLVLAPEVNRADFAETEPYLTWGDLLFEESETFGGGFVNQPFDRQFQIIETFQMLVQDSRQTSTLVGLLVDIDSFVETIVSYYDETSGLFRDGSGEASYENTVKVLTTLDVIGESGVMYDPDWAPYQLIESTYQTQREIEDWDLGEDTLTELDIMYEVEYSLGLLDDVTTKQVPILALDYETGIQTINISIIPREILPNGN